MFWWDFPLLLWQTIAKNNLPAETLSSHGIMNGKESPGETIEKCLGSGHRDNTYVTWGQSDNKILNWRL